MYLFLVIVGAVFLLAAIIYAKREGLESKPAIVLIMISAAFLLPTNVIVLSNYHNPDGSYSVEQENNAFYYHIVCNSNSRYDFGYLQGQALSQYIFNMMVVMHPWVGFIQRESRDLISEFEKYIPQEYREEMRGIARGASNRLGIIVSYEDILLQNIFTDLVYGRQIPQDNLMGCSVVGYVSSNGVVAGQSFDFTKIMGYDNLLDTTVFVLSEFNGTSIFGLRMGGSLSIPMAKTNFYSVFINVVPSLAYNENISTPMFVRTRMALENAQTLEEFESIMDFQSMPGSYNFMFANETLIRGYQVSPEQYHVNSSNFIVNTNRYVHEDMVESLVDPEYSLLRQQQVELMCHEAISNNTLTEERLLEIFEFQCEEEPEKSIYRTGTEGMDTVTICYMSLNYFGFHNQQYSKAAIPL